MGRTPGWMGGRAGERRTKERPPGQVLLPLRESIKIITQHSQGRRHARRFGSLLVSARVDFGRDRGH